MSSISRVLRARFGKKDDEDDCDKKDEDGEKKTKHSIDGILGDKCKLTAENIWPFCIHVYIIISIINWESCNQEVILIILKRLPTLCPLGKLSRIRAAAKRREIIPALNSEPAVVHSLNYLWEPWQKAFSRRKLICVANFLLIHSHI